MTAALGAEAAASRFYGNVQTPASGRLPSKARCLAAYVLDERSRHEVALAYTLDHLASLDRAAARKMIDALQKSKRYTGFAEETRAHVEKLAR